MRAENSGMCASPIPQLCVNKIFCPKTRNYLGCVNGKGARCTRNAAHIAPLRADVFNAQGVIILMGARHTHACMHAIAPLVECVCVCLSQIFDVIVIELAGPKYADAWEIRVQGLRSGRPSHLVMQLT